MPTAALLLVLTAAAVHAGWNRLVHGSEDRLAVMAVAGLAAGFLLGWDAVRHPPLQVWPYVLASAAAEAVYVVLLASAYARGSLAVVYPVGRGTAPLLVTLLAWPLAGESPTPAMLFAAVSLAVGLAVVGGSGGAAGQGTAVRFALATGVSIAAYSVLDAVAVRSTSPAGYLGVVLVLHSVLVIGAGRIDPGRLWAVRWSGLAVGTGTVAAYLLVLLAFRLAPAGRVATLREVSVLLAVALSADRRRPALWWGAGLVALGAVAAAW